MKKLCAIYTRKSTDERLDMEFNSLDAQRESCLAYITSQKSEGWMPAQKSYDDGGFSGGTMERPALTQLIADIKAGKVNIVVVYKIDRLTRSLMDFAKLVDVFDAHGVTFVSVTQSFNTTTSMGRLTLNVLLSFAQFEREVAGERIRDKISASKRKGMWMGGVPPIGYRVKNRQLLIEPENVKLARHIFNRYMVLGSVYQLTEELKTQGIKSPVRISEKGWQHGGAEFSRGAVHTILTNPIYVGKIKHKGAVYDGQHEAIIPQELWDEVQNKLQEQAASPRGCGKAKDTNFLQGILFDADGKLYGPTFTIKNGKRYRYYIQKNLRRSGSGVRIPAFEIEGLVEKAVRKKIDMKETALTHEVFRTVARVTIKKHELFITLHDGSSISVPYEMGRSRKGAILIQTNTPERDIFDLPPSELKKLIQGFVWRDEHFKGATIRDIAGREGVSDSFVGKQIFRTFDHLYTKCV